MSKQELKDFFAIEVLKALEEKELYIACAILQEDIQDEPIFEQYYLQIQGSQLEKQEIKDLFVIMAQEIEANS